MDRDSYLKIYHLRNAHTGRYIIGYGDMSLWCMQLDLTSVSEDRGKWKIVNGIDDKKYFRNFVNPFYIAAAKYSNDYYEVMGSPQGSLMSVRKDGNAFTISYGNEYFLYNDENDACYAVPRNYSNQWSRYQWYLDESPKLPLPEGVYRIRSFNGNYLLTMPPQNATGESETPYVTRHNPNNEAQKWVVTPEQNGYYYTISNPETNTYLMGSGTWVSRGAFHPRSYAFQWKLEHSGLGVAFFIRSGTSSIGFPNYEAEDFSNVTLQPGDKIPSQMWFFEIYNPVTPAKFHRFLESKNYVLESSRNNQYLKVVPQSDELLSTSNRNDATEFTVTYVDSNSANFTLTFPTSSGTSNIIADRWRVVTSANETKEWVVVPHSSGTAYYIREATTAQLRKGFSTQSIQFRRKSYFAFDYQSEDQEQSWRFHIVP
ncbi:hypothetical protein BYT27DRAFT_7203235 [Phlegmacium glaucopus]|nr:hypothetical protein BYT27DRAFT_7203235 [Phlegmacium glaucopus]